MYCLCWEPLREERQERGEEERHQRDHDEAEPPGAQPPCLALAQTALGSNVNSAEWKWYGICRAANDPPVFTITEKDSSNTMTRKR